MQKNHLNKIFILLVYIFLVSGCSYRLAKEHESTQIKNISLREIKSYTNNSIESELESEYYAASNTFNSLSPYSIGILSEQINSHVINTSSTGKIRLIKQELLINYHLKKNNIILVAEDINIENFVSLDDVNIINNDYQLEKEQKKLYSKAARKILLHLEILQK